MGTRTNGYVDKWVHGQMGTWTNMYMDKWVHIHIMSNPLLMYPII